MPTKKIKKNKATKKSVKKATSKKRTKINKVLICSKKCNPEQSFWVNNGPVVDTVCKLRDAIKSMTAEQYIYHTSANGNDFANWVNDCIGDKKMASLVRRARTKSATLRALTTKCCK